MKRYVRLGAYLLTGVLMMHLTACRTHPEREPGQSGPAAPPSMASGTRTILWTMPSWRCGKTKTG